MRISDWSSDACSSDLLACGYFSCARCRAAARAGHSASANRAPACSTKTPTILPLPMSPVATKPKKTSRNWSTSCATPPNSSAWADAFRAACRSEEHTSELQSLMRISYAVFCLKKKKPTIYQINTNNIRQKEIIQTDKIDTQLS